MWDGRYYFAMDVLRLRIELSSILRGRNVVINGLWFQAGVFRC